MTRSNGSFRFYFTHANEGSPSSPIADTGHTAACPFQHYRVVRIECDQANGTDIVYVGDLNVSTTRYVAALSLAGQLAIEIASENIPADRIWMVATNSSATDVVHVSLIYDDRKTDNDLFAIERTKHVAVHEANHYGGNCFCVHRC